MESKRFIAVDPVVLGLVDVLENWLAIDLDLLEPKMMMLEVCDALHLAPDEVALVMGASPVELEAMTTLNVTV